ncbi:MAG TPA: bifunctional DedA family/phosphatase PAP2 family protein [Candidatus Paceibacterota bacterium]
MSYLHFFSALTDTIIAFAVSGGYIALFSLMFLEGIPLLGIAIPGHVAIISAGFLAGTGVLSPWTVLVVATIAAALGDYLSYMLGKIFGWPLIEKLRPFFFVSESVIVKARKILEKHTGKALVFGRFNPVTRGLMPFFVGANKTNAKHFWMWNTVGTLLWIGSSIVIGYAVSLGFHAVEGWASRALLIAIIAAVLIIWGYRFVNIRFHIFKRYELFVLGLNIASLLVFFRMIEDAYSATPFLASFDLYVNALMNTLVTHAGPWLVEAAAWVSALGGNVMMVLLAVVGGIVLATHRKWRSVVILLSSVGTTAFLTGWFKDFIGRFRPENFMTPHAGGLLGSLFDTQQIFNDPSFPSAHAAFAAAFFLAITYLIVPRIRSLVSRELVILGAVILTLVVGVSRLILSVHWASDVIAGWALGIFCATASILFVRYVGTLLVGKVQ